MKKSELKSIIKECVKEILFEEGVLSNLVAEVAFGITKAQQTIVESSSAQQVNNAKLEEARAHEQEEKRKRLLETKRKMLNAMGNSKMSNVFEGTEPLKQGGQPGKVSPHGPMAGRDPSDAGIDISGLFGLAGQKWQQLK
tara:strand:+ start:771 stop:1190 length:420 start_codon:yes stop_codon:yes gene_type:complete